MAEVLKHKGRLLGIALEDIEPKDILASVTIEYNDDGEIFASKVIYSDAWAPGPEADRILCGLAVERLRKGLQ